MTQSKVKRPRVAAIRLNEEQIKSIGPLCGTLRPADSIEEYLTRYDWDETDIVVSHSFYPYEDTAAVPILTVGYTGIRWRETRASGGSHDGQVLTETNTQREVSTHSSCPPAYHTIAGELASQLSNANDPPRAISTTGVPEEGLTPLVVSTSDFPVALRCVRTYSSQAASDGDSKGITLVLPEDADLITWFRAFLADIHEIDLDRVPQPPPRLGNPSDWYTPREREIESEIEQNDVQAAILAADRERLESELAAESEEADIGIRQAIWADGDDLESAVEEILADLGFKVENMDAGLKPGKPKHEDFRLTLDGISDWEAIVEVKGYTNGIKTNDAQQVRKHRDLYISEKGKPPDLTLWIVNPYRNDDPDSRPSPDGNAETSAALVGAACIQTTDLYKLWMRVAHEEMPAADAAQQLIDAEPGLWSLPALD